MKNLNFERRKKIDRRTFLDVYSYKNVKGQSHDIVKIHNDKTTLSWWILIWNYIIMKIYSSQNRLVTNKHTNITYIGNRNKPIGEIQSCGTFRKYNRVKNLNVKLQN